MSSAVYDYSKRKPVEKYPVYTSVYLVRYLTAIPTNIALQQCKEVFHDYVDKAKKYYKI